MRNVIERAFAAHILLGAPIMQFTIKRLWLAIVFAGLSLACFTRFQTLPWPASDREYVIAFCVCLPLSGAFAGATLGTPFRSRWVGALFALAGGLVMAWLSYTIAYYAG